MPRPSLFLQWCLALAVPAIGQSAEPATFDSLAKPFLESHCIDCHGSDAPEAGVSLDQLDGITAENAALWTSVWEQVALKEMPPEPGDEGPALIDRHRLSNWITAELQQAMKDKGGFRSHAMPSKGNHLNHDLLFGAIPDGLEPTSTPARLWRLHPLEHLTRLSSLINQEPAFDPKRPGMRARGDFVPPNQEGEIKVYYGLDRAIGWVGGTAAYAASITGFPPILSSDDHHGLRSYPLLYSVNGAEATQLARNAETILRFMAYGPDAQEYQFADKLSDIDEKYKHGDLRGLAESLFYSHEVKRPLTPVYDLLKQDADSEQKNARNRQLRSAIAFLFESLTGRPPTKRESNQYFGVVKQSIEDLGKEEGAILGLTSIFLDRDALFRPELAQGGQPDEYGRVMLQGHELALAVNAAFCYLGPDDQLKQALADRRLVTRDDVKREVQRILADPSIRKPRLLQFFREYFDYDRAGAICKDTQALRRAGGDPKDATHYRIMFRMASSTDRLIELVLEEDQNVLKELLTTNRVVLDTPDAPYYGEFVSSDRPPVEKTEGKKKRGAQRTVTIKPLKPPKGETVHGRVARVVKYNSKTARTLTTLPSEQRMGILTHPAWLVSHSDAMDNHAILRGRWVRERLLGDAVPDVPITVDAMLPDEPKETLRHRMRVTREDECWRCHKKMDPLGLPFEMYNHVGLYRTVEHEKPVDTSGEIIGSGDPQLDGPVTDAIDMIRKLSESERVEQVFVRHAFRFWMGRNETLNDAPALQAAHRAYKEAGGSMNALLVSLLTSDAFLYRKVDY